MKTSIATVFCALALSSGAVEIDGVAAQVGPVSILKSDVEREMRRRGCDDPSRFDETRNRLVERELILRAAASSKMTMQDWVVEDRVRSIVEEAFGGDRNKLVEALAKEKIPYSDWKKRIKEDLVVNAMRWQVVDKNVRASPAAMAKEYGEHPEDYRKRSKVTVSVILLKPEDAAKKAEVDEALKTLSFAEAAKKYSADGKASEGGQWKDIVPEEVFKPEICAEIAKTPEGVISHWVEIDGWNFLLRKDSAGDAAPRTFAEAYSDIEAKIKAAESKRLYEAWIERLKAETHVHIY